MTATPIPRTLSLTAYGDLDAPSCVSAVGRPRQDLGGGERRSGAYEFVRERLREGRQAFFVCPLVEGSEKLEAKAAAEEAERLAAGELREFEASSSTGRCTPRDKARAMDRFMSGAADARGHQRDRGGDRRAERDRDGRRGRRALWPIAAPPAAQRGGRGAHESFCILFGDPTSETARRRLDAIATERDGFKLAEVDLTLRGEGEILGTCCGLPASAWRSCPTTPSS